MKSQKPTVILMGGFGNQLFQLAFGMSRFGGNTFNLEGTLGVSRVNSLNALEMTEYQLPDEVEVLYTNPHRLIRKCHNLALRIGLRAKKKNGNFGLLSKKLLVALSLVVSVVTHTKTIFRVCNDLGFGTLNGQTLTNSEVVIGYFQSYRWIDDNVLRKLKEMKYKKDSEILSQFAFRASTAKPIIVHIRLGDYENESGIGILPEKYYLNGLRELTHKYTNSEIWIFSNDLEKAKAYFTTWQGNKITFIEDRWNSTTLTFEIMRLGHAYLIANSTFSYWAALLSRTTQPMIIAPHPWFLKAQSPTDLVPTNWVKMEF